MNQYYNSIEITLTISFWHLSRATLILFWIKVSVKTYKSMSDRNQPIPRHQKSFITVFTEASWSRGLWRTPRYCCSISRTNTTPTQRPSNNWTLIRRLQRTHTAVAWLHFRFRQPTQLPEIPRRIIFYNLLCQGMFGWC